MARDQAVEEVAQRRKVQFAGGDAGSLFDKRGQVLADVARRDADELKSALFTSDEKLLDGVTVGATGVFIPDRAAEKLFGGEYRCLSGTVNDLRQLADAGDELALERFQGKCRSSGPLPDGRGSESTIYSSSENALVIEGDEGSGHSKHPLSNVESSL